MFQLKEYQGRCLEELAGYFRRILAFQGVTDKPEKMAFEEKDGRAPYQQVKELPGLPYVCLRVPTGGGKTVMASHANDASGVSGSAKQGSHGTKRMTRYTIVVGLVACAVWGQAARAQEAASLGDFDSGNDGWEFTSGQEFPGAKGGAEPDREQKKVGAGALRISGDFSKGGEYVGVWRPLQGVDIGTLSFWVRGEGLGRLTVRLSDDTGQWHQVKDVPLADTTAWQEVKLTIERFLGGEHWGGANDGKWHALAVGRNGLLKQGIAGYASRRRLHQIQGGSAAEASANTTPNRIGPGFQEVRQANPVCLTAQAKSPVLKYLR